MPVTKQYLRYEESSAFGVVCSRKAGALLFDGHLLDKNRKGRRLALAPALDHVIIWDLKTSEKVEVLKGDSHEVTSLCLSPSSPLVAIGYDDGNIKIFNMETARDTSVTFSGHSSSVISLSFDGSGTRLVSGGKDTDVIIWDVINECGLYRLKGHKGPVTWSSFMKDNNVLITSSKDTMVKFWDLDTQHCFETLTESTSEVWGCVLLPSQSKLVTLSSDSELRVYELSPAPSHPLNVSLVGSIKRQLSTRPLGIRIDGRGSLMVVMSGDHLIEVYGIRNEEEIDKRRRKRIKKSKKKAAEAGLEWVESDTPTYVVEDQFHLLYNFNSSHRMKSCDIVQVSDNNYQLLLSLHENMLQIHSLSLSPSPSSCLHHSLTAPGHRSDIRSLCLSSDGSLLSSGSNDVIKIWRLRDQSMATCIHTLTDCGYVVSLCVVPGDRHLLAGTKSGDVHLYEISSGILLETFKAHSGSVWSVGVSPGRRGFTTCSADHDVKFWEFELITDEDRPGR
ncbi:PREDICTED: WD repeat-containing protein 3-like [Amphimedon queenslandica]|uniref:Anaphase-promoting complex subunit 4 WD40 domain-containing protein n=1 Tax=Amphimedon queenslandica TaxID=400682 RepID=A0AAN0JN17_AMPQE|nr:PREDICTED: WD repeat-containing protein 3-like [Amphimedon queenslandica]|eukprot:XP_019858403.1 PREDICTED: WD repeat-containing protein 3-like [Amphimedon queenslandica]